MLVSDAPGRIGAAAGAVVDRPLSPALRRELRGWCLLAAGSLAVAGIAAPLLGISRAPGIEKIVKADLNELLYWALVPHVVFSFVVWFVAALGALSVVVVGRAGGGRSALGSAGLGAAVAGAVLLLVPTLASMGYPSINNYVPVLVHPLYYLGLGLLGVGVGLAVLRMFAAGGRFEGGLEFGIAISGAAYLVAMICFALAWAQLPEAGPFDAANLNERLFWGGGHVLQFVNTGIMLALWYAAAEQVFGVPPLGRDLYRLSMASLLAFVLPAPAFYFMFDVMSIAHRNAFTDLLWYGLTLPPVVLTVGVAAQMARRWRSLPWRDVAFVGLFLSVLVFNVGGVFGFFLGVSDTRTPSHYHGVIGGVNLAIMVAFATLFLPRLGRPFGTGKAAKAAFWLYGLGQMFWSLGMFVAGAAGVPRKTAGAEQQLDALGTLGMGISGSAHLVAIAGGVMFIWMALARLLRKESGNG